MKTGFELERKARLWLASCNASANAMHTQSSSPIGSSRSRNKWRQGKTKSRKIRMFDRRETMLAMHGFHCARASVCLSIYARICLFVHAWPCVFVFLRAHRKRGCVCLSSFADSPVRTRLCWCMRVCVSVCVRVR